MNNTAPTFAKQDSLKFFRTLNSRLTVTSRKQHSENRKLETIPKNNNSLFRFAPYFLILTLGMPFWAHLLLTIVMGIGMAGVE
jgi:linoleoyl-CoA desaturase